MESPYRPLPVAAEKKTFAVCAWCKHSTIATGAMGLCYRVCNMSRVRRLDPEEGWRWTSASPCQNPHGECKDYAPSLLTHIAWWRRAP